MEDGGKLGSCEGILVGRPVGECEGSHVEGSYDGEAVGDITGLLEGTDDGLHDGGDVTGAELGV